MPSFEVQKAPEATARTEDVDNSKSRLGEDDRLIPLGPDSENTLCSEDVGSAKNSRSQISESRLSAASQVVPEIPKFAAALDAVLQRALTSCTGPPAAFGCSDGGSCNSSIINASEVAVTHTVVHTGTSQGRPQLNSGSLKQPSESDCFSSNSSSGGGFVNWLLTSIFGGSNNSVNDRTNETEYLTGGSTLGAYCSSSYEADTTAKNTMESLLTPGLCYSRLLQMQRARKLRDAREFNSSFLHYQKALDAPPEIDPNSDCMITDSVVYRELGQTLYDASRPQEAIAAFEKGIESMTDPDTSVFYQKGVVHLTIGQYDEALDSFQKILQSDPRDVSTLFQCALVEQKRQRFSNALQYTDKLLEVQPDHYEAEVMRAECLSALGRESESLIVMQRLCRAYPHRVGSLTRLISSTQTLRPS